MVATECDIGCWMSGAFCGAVGVFILCIILYWLLDLLPSGCNNGPQRFHSGGILGDKQWEDYVDGLERSAVEECRLYRRRLGLPDVDDLEALQCSNEQCRAGCPIWREPGDA